MPELYWKEVNEPYKYTDRIDGKEYEGIIKRKMWSDNPKVENIWMHGGMSANPGSIMVNFINIEATDGRRFEKSISPEEFDTLNIPEAIEFIKSL